VDDAQRRSELFDRLAVVGKAFASPNRLKIIDLLGQGERSVESLAHELGLGVSTASAHLQILKLANVVSTRSGPIWTRNVTWPTNVTAISASETTAGGGSSGYRKCEN